MAFDIIANNLVCAVDLVGGRPNLLIASRTLRPTSANRVLSRFAPTVTRTYKISRQPAAATLRLSSIAPALANLIPLPCDLLIECHVPHVMVQQVHHHRRVAYVRGNVITLRPLVAQSSNPTTLKAGMTVHSLRAGFVPIEGEQLPYVWDHKDFSRFRS
jgi:hypothetical protein